MKRVIYFLLILPIVVSCNIFNPIPDPEDQLDFKLFEEIKVDVSLSEGTRCLLFTSYPYDEDGTLVSKPAMIAYSPISKIVTVPNSIENVYMYANGTLIEYPRGDISLTTLETKSDASGLSVKSEGEENPGDYTIVTIPDGFITAINLCYPEAVVNVPEDGHEINLSTDLIAPKGIKEVVDGKNVEYGPTKVWTTYITNGGFSYNGSLWYYTYQVDEDGTPITSLIDVEKNLVNIYDNVNNSSIGKRVYLGEFEPGTRIGFKFSGKLNGGYNYPKYSTPHYNALAYGEENRKTAGILYLLDYDGESYAVLGMETRLPSEGAKWDGDFNDMVCLIEATPTVSIENVLEPPVIEPERTEIQGYWMFEDTYPNEGDYDFNDIVVNYTIVEEEGKDTDIEMIIMAKGAARSNKFGVNNTIYLENLNGFKNVFASHAFITPDTVRITLAKAASYIPMMNNGEATFDLNTYFEQEKDFPCVLNIPVNVSNPKSFQWALEKVRIDTAYPRYKEWVKSKCTTNTDWYLDTPVAGTIWNK